MKDDAYGCGGKKGVMEIQMLGLAGCNMIDGGKRSSPLKDRGSKSGSGRSGRSDNSDGCDRSDSWRRQMTTTKA